MPVPDLLSHVAGVRLDVAALKQTLTFGFASGVPDTALAQHLETALPASTWDPGSFAKELFLSELITGCCKVTIETRAYAIDRGNLARILARPPLDQADSEMRRGVLRDLAGSETLRRDFERIYVSLYQFRSLLEAPPLARRAAGNRRRLDILTAIKSAIDAMTESFRENNSALSRLRQFGLDLSATDSYRRLRDLLDYDENLSTLDVRVRVGFDGRVRGLEMLAVKENESNWFYASPLGRFFAKLGSLFRGYRFSEQELLARLIDGVYEGLENEIVQLFQLIGDMEFYLAALAFRDFAKKAGLDVCLPDLVAPSGEGAKAPARTIRDLFNPLLLAQGIHVVPCDIVTD